MPFTFYPVLFIALACFMFPSAPQHHCPVTDTIGLLNKRRLVSYLIGIRVLVSLSE